MSDFQKEFLDKYLQLGLGSMPKADVDALVMHLLDRHGLYKGAPLAGHSNQTVSETLKTPVAKIKKLRYDAALKFGGRVEDQAQGRLLAALSKATLEPDGSKVCLIIEDALAKNWLQGQLKNNQQIFDYSFNTEIIKVSASGLFTALESVFDKKEIRAFRDGYEKLKKQSDTAAIRAEFKKLASNFAHSAARAAGGSVAAILTAHLAAG